MGVRLIVEVLDHWQDAGLTAGERSDLLLLAENANDRSRLTWGPVHAEYMLHRANKSSAGWKNSIGKLLKKGVLVQHAQGHVGQVAVYRLAQLCPEAPHDGWRGHCTRPERVTSEVTLSDWDEAEEGHLSGDPYSSCLLFKDPLLHLLLPCGVVACGPGAGHARRRWRRFLLRRASHDWGFHAGAAPAGRAAGGRARLPWPSAGVEAT
ncbi:hypothetical protein OG402_33835 [Streptomyces anulatus]|uniref:hypothetical protein n=1 Tax=Streptomyces anulatus TaxID=1892 RepID=UPI002253A3A1|nr:hypothetical protein [Streptomyces anulatus]MCX4605450.1 hypothetical protein [Streptomyces anulatus]